MEHKLFSTLPPLKLFFRCALPSMAGMAVSSLYMVADGIFVGKFIGSNALAAINLVMPIIMISFALSDMVAVGSSVQISIRLGQGKEKEACCVFSFSTILIVAISCLVGLVGYFGGAQAVSFMGAGEDVLALAGEYMRVYAGFAPCIMIFFALDNYLRVCGKSIYSMGMNIFIALANLFFDWLFIVHFRMGVASAALASCISLTMGTVIGLLPFFRKETCAALYIAPYTLARSEEHDRKWQLRILLQYLCLRFYGYHECRSASPVRRDGCGRILHSHVY